MSRCSCSFSIFLPDCIFMPVLCSIFIHICIPYPITMRWSHRLLNDSSFAGDRWCWVVHNYRYGPLCNIEQLNVVRELVEDARSGGARVLMPEGAEAGSGGGSRGYFHPPTIIADVDDSSRIVREEQFGPVIPILRYRTEEEAVARANATDFGLGGSVWSRDIERAAELAQQLECGMVWVNQLSAPCSCKCQHCASLLCMMLWIDVVI